MSNLSQSRIAVVIPTYNRGAYLALTIESVLAQTRPADEILVVDDGSTDDTTSLCAPYPVRYLFQENQGQGGARNTGVAATDADIIWFLDDDDLLEPHAIAHHMAIMEADPLIDVLYARTARIDAAGEREGEDLVGHALPADPLASLLTENFVRIQSVAVRRSALEAVGGFDPDLVPCEDYDLWIRLAAAGKRFHYTPEIVARYRVHAGSVSAQYERMARTMVRVTQKAAVALGPAASAGAHYRLGRVLLDQEHYPEASAEFAQALQACPGSTRYRAYAFLAAHPGLLRGGVRYAQWAKRLLANGLAKAGLAERRWGS